MAKRDALNKPLDADGLYVCWQSFAGDGLDKVIQKGATLRGNNRAVTMYPGFFVAAGTPDDEWPSAFADMPAPNNARILNPGFEAGWKKF